MDKLYVLPTAGADNTNANLNNIIFTIKDAKVYVSVVTLSATQNKKRSNFLAKHLKDQFIWMNMKQKVRIKIQQINKDTFSNQILLEVIDYLFYFKQIKIPILKELRLEDIIYQKAK